MPVLEVLMMMKSKNPNLVDNYLCSGSEKEKPFIIFTIPHIQISENIQDGSLHNGYQIHEK